jgi:hypothetical protein
MKTFGKVLTVVAVAAGCSVLSAPQAMADHIYYSTTTHPAIIDTSTTFTTSPMWLSQPAVVVDTPSTVIRTAPVVTTPVYTSPTVISSPTFVRDRGLLDVGIPGLFNFSLF